MAEEIERIYVIPLKKDNPRSSVAAPHAVKTVKSFLTKHMKVETDKVWIDDSLNNALWKRGKFHIPSKIRVKAVKFDDGVVEAYLPELEFKKSRREILKEEKAKKEPILKKEAPGEEAPAEGEVEVVPAADGEVKIKKKKVHEKKEKHEKEEPAAKEKKKEEKTEEKPEKKAAKPKAKKKAPSKPKTKPAKTTKKAAKKKSE